MLFRSFQPTPQTPEQVADGLRAAMKQAKEDGVFDEPIQAKVSDEDFQKIVDLMNNQEPYPDAMFEEAERREKLNAGFKQDENGNWYRPELKDLTRNERITLAEKEIAYIVMGGQDGREYANSIAFLLQVLDSVKDEEH